MTIEKLQLQINAIQKKLNSGKVKNVYAAKIRIYKLQKQIENIKHFNFLAQ